MAHRQHNHATCWESCAGQKGSLLQVRTLCRLPGALLKQMLWARENRVLKEPREKFTGLFMEEQRQRDKGRSGGSVDKDA